MDPLTAALDFLDVRAAHPCRLETGGAWAMSFAEFRHIRVGLVLSGAMWLTPGGSAPLPLRAGEGYLLTSGLPYVIGSDPGLKPADGTAVFAAVWPDPVRHNLTAGATADTVAISGAITFDDGIAPLLLDHLPPVAVIHGGTPEARGLRPTLELLAQETAAELPGGRALREHLTYVLFVQALRAVLQRGDTDSPGWLRALTDSRLRPALQLIHGRPDRPWTVADLAAASSMSRTAFAVHFRATVGMPPLDYLIRWRVRSAGRALRSTDRTVSAVANQFGFGSESSFIRTFKRVTGRSPSRYRLERTAGRA
ncbi:AraC family transcriptional regulator [Actinoplanes sp. M2I2]|uniref:AraC family transcriptional regulator n=1 Tax=Actinoplanes sp. M2I2 TaxID=1734444 RepID=UPI0020215F5D|nr:AraC family transcriptional regulator [Actinoplanes sp. M2I2]